MMLLALYIQTIGLIIICQPHQVEIANKNAQVCTCKSSTANGKRRKWCYCQKCKKPVCLCCAAKDHYIHNHSTTVVPGIKILVSGMVSSRSCFMESLQSQCCYTALLHALYWNSYFIIFMVCLMQQEFFFVIQQDLRQLGLVCLKWQELFNLEQQNLEEVLHCLKQQEVNFLELFNLKQVELLFLKLLEILSLEKMDLICLK